MSNSMLAIEQNDTIRKVVSSALDIIMEVRARLPRVWHYYCRTWHIGHPRRANSDAAI